MQFPPGRLQVELEQLSEKGIVGPYRDALEDLLVAQWASEEGLQNHLNYFAKCAADFRAVAMEMEGLKARLAMAEELVAALKEIFEL
jgi:hypothetical protein